MNAAAVLKVGDGRGFVVSRLPHQGIKERVVVTAAHCLPFLPPPHPARYLHEHTYERLLGALGCLPDVSAECLYVDPMADIAVLSSPDNQDRSDEAEAYEELMNKIETPFLVADAPPEIPYQHVIGGEVITINIEGKPTEVEIQCQEIPHIKPGEASVSLLSLAGKWFCARVERRGPWLDIDAKLVGGMSGSPIVVSDADAIGVVSVDRRSPVLIDNLSVWLWRSIIAAQNNPRE
jgi:hypothetical protein